MSNKRINYCLGMIRKDTCRDEKKNRFYFTYLVLFTYFKRSY